MSVITDSDNGKLCGIVYCWTLTIKQHMFWADNTDRKKDSLEVLKKVQENRKTLKEMEHNDRQAC